MDTPPSSWFDPVRITMPLHGDAQPTVRGTDIPVFVVIAMLMDDRSREEILAFLPELELADIEACVAFMQHRLQTMLAEDDYVEPEPPRRRSSRGSARRRSS
jgi:uncharacterized protein (DUF433 family)